MNRNDLISLVDQFKVDAETLKISKRNNGAFYLLGYVIETALKVCVCSYFSTASFPPSIKGFKFYIHDFDQLLILSGLYKELYSSSMTDSVRVNWNILNKWSPDIRYESSPVSDIEIEEAFEAVFQKKDGVLSWLQKNW